MPPVLDPKRSTFYFERTSLRPHRFAFTPPTKVGYPDAALVAVKDDAGYRFWMDGGEEKEWRRGGDGKEMVMRGGGGVGGSLGGSSHHNALSILFESR